MGLCIGCDTCHRGRVVKLGITDTVCRPGLDVGEPWNNRAMTQPAPTVHVDTHDPLCPYGGFMSQPDDCRIWPGSPSVCDLIRNVRADERAKVRKAIVDGLKVGLPPSDTRDAAVSIATFAVSST